MGGNLTPSEYTSRKKIKIICACVHCELLSLCLHFCNTGTSEGRTKPHKLKEDKANSACNLDFSQLHMYTYSLLAIMFQTDKNSFIFQCAAQVISNIHYIKPKNPSFTFIPHTTWQTNCYIQLEPFKFSA